MHLSRRTILLAAGTALPMSVLAGRPAQAGERSSIDIRQAGAVGDGVADDTAAINAALASHDIVYFPAGKYVHDGRLRLRAGQELRGDGETSILLCPLEIASNSAITWLVVKADDCSTFAKVCDGAKLTGVHFLGGNELACLSFDDNRVTNCTFTFCKFSGNSKGNGVKIVEKGYHERHYEDLTFTSCEFYDNARMNFEAIQRQAERPVVMGYQRINLTDCVATGTDYINVSFDSEFLSDGSARSSGHSTLSGTRIIGGSVGLELAGSVHMTVASTTVTDTLQQAVVVCQVSVDEDAGHHFVDSTFAGKGNNDFSGANNLIERCSLSSPGRAMRLTYARNNVVDGCTLSSTSATVATIENAHDNDVRNSTFRGGSYNSLLVIYGNTNNNSVHDCTFENFNIPIDVRDGNSLNKWGNVGIMPTGENRPV